MQSNRTLMAPSMALLGCVLLLGCVYGEKNQKTVVVVGAGMSGITAARYLLNYTDFRVIVLEAHNRTGGRINSYVVPGHGGKPVELGAIVSYMAEWQAQPIRRYCDAHGIATKWFNLSVDSIESHLNHSINDFTHPLHVDSLMKALSLANPPGLSDPWWSETNLPDKPVLQAIQQHEKYSLVYNSLSNYGKQFLDLLLEINSALPHELLSVRMFQGVKPKPNTKTTAWPLNANDKVLPGGYSQVINSLITAGEVPVDVRLNTVVRQITVYDNKVNIVTKDNRKFVGDYAILTVPIGAMKAKTIDFNPSLSSEYRHAVDQIGAANFVKFLIVFDQPFWPLNRTRFFFFPTTANGIRVHFINYYLINELPALMCHIIANSADMARSLTDEQLLEQMLMNLKAMFPQANPTVKHFIRKDWLVDPFTLGDYASPLVGMTFDDAYNIRKVHEGRLMFAGEHTGFVDIPKPNPGVLGAFLSGYRAATEVMQSEGFAPPPKPVT